MPYGVCMHCKKPIEDDIYHCSKECRSKENRKMLAKMISDSEYCEICKKKAVHNKEEIKDEFDIDLPENLIYHHIKYYPEETLRICRSCHMIIHKTDKYPELIPKKEDIKKYYKKMNKKKFRF